MLIGAVFYFVVIAPFQNQPGFTYTTNPAPGPSPSSVNPSPSPSRPTPPTANPGPNPQTLPAPQTGAFRVIKGAFVIIGKQPDGDSVRFIPDRPSLLGTLRGGNRIRTSSDGSVQLRFEAIDAPEVHFGSASQPLGKESRDTLLRLMGFSNVRYTSGGLQVSASTPERVRGAILSAAAESNGRPVSYVLLERDTTALRDGSSIAVDSALLVRTMNYAMLENGMTYLTVYDTTPAAHRAIMQSVAQIARQARRGVWARDKTNDFTLENASSVGPNGQLILPKLFRRVTSYLTDRSKGKYGGSLPGWIVWASRQPQRNENDPVQLANGAKTTLNQLVTQQGTRVRFKPDLLEIVFGD